MMSFNELAKTEIRIYFGISIFLRGDKYFYGKEIIPEAIKVIYEYILNCAYIVIYQCMCLNVYRYIIRQKERGGRER